MQRSLRDALLVLLFVGTCLFGAIASAETGFLVVHVEDVQGHPVRGVQIGVKGDGGSDTSDPHGTVRIRLAPRTQATDWVTLQVLHSPPGKDLVLLSPWDSRAVVPSFENKSDNFVDVVVVESGDRAALANPAALRAFAEKINKANAPKTADRQAAEDPKGNLDAVAKQYGLTSDELDKAILAWKTTGPYEVGLKALYAHNYDTAANSLRESLKQREEKLATAQKDVADAAFFLGQSLYGQGKYRASATAFQRCLQIRPHDPMVLNNTALSLEEAGDYTGAEPLYRQALAINEKALGRDHLEVAKDLNNLANLLLERGDYAAAEPLYRRALAIDEKALGPDHPTVATARCNLAALLIAEGNYAVAESLLRRALAIDEKALGPDHPDVATILNNLGVLLKTKGDYRGADLLYNRALEIDKKTRGPEHPDVARDLNNLASLLEANGDYVAAERFYREALAIAEKALGPDHPHVATDLKNLGLLLAAKGDYAGAEPLYRRALAIDEKALGSDHPDVANRLNNLAELLEAEGNYAGAEPLFRRALAIEEKAVGPDHPDVATDLDNLGSLLAAKGDYAGAEPLLRRALAIGEKALGPNHPDVATALNNLAGLLYEKGDYAGAEPLLRRALAIDEKALGPDHPKTQQIKSNLDGLLKKMGTRVPSPARPRPGQQLATRVPTRKIAEWLDFSGPIAIPYMRLSLDFLAC